MISNNPITDIIHILYVDDEPNLLCLQKEVLENEKSFDVTTANSVKKATQLLDGNSFDIIISDYEMPIMNGLQFLELLRKNENNIPFILFTGKGREEIVIQALNLGADRYIQKGIDSEAMNTELTDAIKKIVNNRRKDIEYTQTLKNASDEWKQTFDSITDIASVISKDHTILKVNKTAIDNTGLSETQLIGKKCYEIVHGTKYPIPECPCEKSLKTKSFETAEIKINKKWYNASSYPIINNNEITSFTHTIKDIDETKKIYISLKESERKYRELVESSQDMIFRCDLEGRLIFINKSWADEHGYTIAEMQNKPFSDFITPEAAKRDLILFYKLLAGSSISNYDTTHITKSGKTIHLLFNAQPIFDSEQHIIGSQGTAINITERIEMENILRKKELKYEQLFELSPTPIFNRDFFHIKEAIDDIRAKGVKDFEKYFHEHPDYLDKLMKLGNNVFDVNDEAVNVFEAKNKDDLIKNYLKIFTPKSYQVLKEFIIILTKGEKYFETESENMTLTGKKIQTIIRIIIPTNNLDFKCIPLSIIDITKQKQMESEKIESILSLIKSISHDLRNPLSSINNAVYLLKDASGEKKEKMLDIIKRSVNSANTLLRNLTEFDKEITLNLEKTDINSLIKESLADLVIPDNIKKNVAKNDVIQVNLDKEKIKRTFMNLFLNAIQAMPNGGKLTVTSTIKDNITEIVIQDTGIGISKNNLKKMFTPYFSTKNSGIGLGLTNTKKIIEAHKGTINIESTEGKGTTVKIKLPIT